MRITVRYLGQVRQAAGRASETIDVPDGTPAAEAARLLALEHRSSLAPILLDEENRLRNHIVILVDGEQALGGGPVLRDGQTLTILPPMAGGSPEEPYGPCGMDPARGTSTRRSPAEPPPPLPRTPLDEEERKVYEWQMWVKDFGEAGQERLKSASVLVSRVGGVGGTVAYLLAAAGVGRLILAHRGNVKPSDLNRQLLMTHDWLGKPRVESAARRLRELNPRVEVVAVPENVSRENAAGLVAQADLVADCAPLFEERFLLNREAVRQGKPLVECAMYDLEFQLTTILPGLTPCLACLYPDKPAAWRREFPVFGAVSSAVASLAAVEAIKVLAGFGDPLAGILLTADLRIMDFQRYTIRRRPDCPVCAEAGIG